ncbi:MAG TPA: chorismate synthase, partial [Campylobacterales bacterium]|nr:chorismate synthase [Campylobacterales bacterium]
GIGCKSSKIKGSQNNDQITKDGFLSNNAGGILGGISNSEPIEAKLYFKPTPSIFKKQKSIDIYQNEIEFELKGRHDPCVAIRGTVVAEAMMALVLADMLLLNTTSKLENLKRVYG